VIPVFNSAETIPDLIRAIEALHVPGGLELILVNDCSSDQTESVCRNLLPQALIPITLVNLSRNYGEHSAVLTGLRLARGEWVITMDDDLQNPPEEVIRLYEFAKNGSHDVVYTYYETKKHAFWRNWGSRFTNWVADRLLEKPRGLYLSSFRCMTRFVAEQAARYTGPFVYVDGLILHITQNIGRLQVRHLPRAKGQSGYNLRRLVRLWLNMFVNFSIMPLRVATICGAFLGLAGFLGVAGVFIEYFFFAQTPSGWGSLMSALLLFSGVQLLMLGVAGEYLGRVYLTVNQRPQATIREITYSPSAAAHAPDAQPV
jgi:undecaprenyl-phosphate 4-deoxy-4-formamido-L-arabinose transferase